MGPFNEAKLHGGLGVGEDYKQARSAGGQITQSLQHHIGVVGEIGIDNDAVEGFLYQLLDGKVWIGVVIHGDVQVSHEARQNPHRILVAAEQE
jgi:hypothetical protein